jgi:hypothetical protein
MPGHYNVKDYGGPKRRHPLQEPGNVDLKRVNCLSRLKPRGARIATTDNPTIRGRPDMELVG